jgi:hypothetical protein
MHLWRKERQGLVVKKEKEVLWVNNMWVNNMKERNPKQTESKEKGTTRVT